MEETDYTSNTTNKVGLKDTKVITDSGKEMVAYGMSKFELGHSGIYMMMAVVFWLEYTEEQPGELV